MASPSSTPRASGAIPRSRQIARERSKVVTIAMPPSADNDERLQQIIEAYKTRFKQQSVGLIVRRPACRFRLAPVGRLPTCVPAIETEGRVMDRLKLVALDTTTSRSSPPICRTRWSRSRDIHWRPAEQRVVVAAQPLRLGGGAAPPRRSFAAAARRCASSG